MEEISLREYHERPKPIKKNVTVPSHTIVAGVAVVLLVIGFGGGVLYQKGKSPAVSTAQAASTQQNSSGSSRFSGGAGGFQRGNRAVGTVSAVSDSSITIAARSGSSSTYAITSSTTVTNSGQTASVSDIQAGDTVVITLDSTTTKDAASIMLNPSFGGEPGGTTDSGSSTDSSGTSRTSVPTQST